MSTTSTETREPAAGPAPHDPERARPCDECRADFETCPEDGTTYHLDAGGRPDHDADADHVPYGPE